MLTTGRATLATVPLGGEAPVAVMGALNVSPESFYRGSMHTDGEALLRAALLMAEAGAALIDVGARSTAPYLPTEISEDEEAERLARAVERLARKLPVPISADTTRPAPARAALEAGARVINDVTGLRDPSVAALVAQHGAGLILMASPGAGEREAGGVRRPVRADCAAPGEESGKRTLSPRARPRGRRTPPASRSPSPSATVQALLSEAVGRARAAGIPEERIVLDPGIGFFLDEPEARAAWDVTVLVNLAALHGLGRPLCVGVSRKSFVGAITGRADPAARLAGSLAATTAAVLGGAGLIRTHDVAETLDAVRVAERLRRVARP